MGEDGKFFERFEGLAKVELVPDDGVAPAAIDDVTGGDGSRAGRRFHRKAGAVGGKIDFLDGGLLMDLGAGLRGVVEQQFVEVGPLDLVGFCLIEPETGPEIESHLARPAGTGHFAADFFHADAVELLPHAQALERRHAVGKQRFADVEAGKFLALEHDGLAPVPRQDGRRSAAGGSAANDGYVVIRMHGKPGTLTNRGN